MSDTACESCRRAERTLIQRISDWAQGTGYGSTRLVSSVMESQAGIMSAMAGKPPLTWYDRHRAEYERTGDPLELTRMERHIQ